MNVSARFVGWWATLSMLLATTGTCPCCGRPPCARGVALLGLLGALIPAFLRPKVQPQNKENAHAQPETSP